MQKLIDFIRKFFIKTCFVIIIFSSSCKNKKNDINHSFLIAAGFAPKVVLISNPTSKTTDPYARFEFTAEGSFKIECAIDGNNFQTCQSPLQLPLKQNDGLYKALEKGNHRIDFRSVTAIGTTGEITTFEWTIGSVYEFNSADFSMKRLKDGEVFPLLTSESDAAWKGILRINCEFDHAAYDDPIVYPGRPGAAHLHMFWGAKKVDAYSDFDSINRSSESGCSGGVLNRSSYWFPGLLAPKFNQITNQRELDSNGNPAWDLVMPKVGEGAEGSNSSTDAHEVFYYSASVDNLDSIQTPPIGLRIIAGNGSAVPGNSQSFSIARWHCRSWNSSDANGGPWSASIPECKLGTDANGQTVGDMLRFDIFFPSCWNGKDLDSTDHKSHMAYPITSAGKLVCPGTHPVPIVRVSYHFSFPILLTQVDPITKANTGWRLASDNYTVQNNNGGLSLHGDWFNGWHPEIMNTILNNCVKGKRDCHDGNLAWLNNGIWQNSLSLGRLINAKGTGIIPQIINNGLGDGHSH